MSARPAPSRPFRFVLVPMLACLALLASGCKNSSTTNASPQVSASATVDPGSGSTTVEPGTGGSTDASAQPSASAVASVDANGCPTSNTVAFAKTKFVLHTGLAFGAFHRYLYKPYRSGTLSSGGFTHKAVAFAKAGAAALFIKREVRLATEDVKASPVLCRQIAAPLTALSDSISGAVSKLRSGDPSGLEDAQKQIGSIEGDAKSGGAEIVEDPNAPLN